MRIGRPLSFFFLAVVAMTACKTKEKSCAKVTQALAPIIAELDATAAEAGARPPPSPADQASCAPLAEQVRRVESAEAKLALVLADDATLAKHLDDYRKNVSLWAKATKKTQAGCFARDGNMMTAGLAEAIQHRSQLEPAKNDITAYCAAP